MVRALTGRDRGPADHVRVLDERGDALDVRVGAEPEVNNAVREAFDRKLDRARQLSRGAGRLCSR